MAQRRKQTAIDLLLRQHEEIRKQFTKVRKAKGQAREEAFAKLRHLLSVHETAEEEIIHPFARHIIGNGDRIIDARLKEEERAKEILQEMERAGTKAADFPTLLDRLERTVESHSRKEESVEFPAVKAKASPRDLVTMVNAVKAAEAVAPTHPHPRIESPAEHLTVGSLASVADRTRDAIQNVRHGSSKGASS